MDPLGSARVVAVQNFPAPSDNPLFRKGVLPQMPRWRTGRARARRTFGSREGIPSATPLRPSQNFGARRMISRGQSSRVAVALLRANPGNAGPSGIDPQKSSWFPLIPPSSGRASAPSGCRPAEGWSRIPRGESAVASWNLGRAVPRCSAGFAIRRARQERLPSVRRGSGCW